MWKSKSWESKSPKFRELPRMGEGSPQGLEEHLHPKRRSGWSLPPRMPHPHCHPTLARAGCEASQANDFPLRLPFNKPEFAAAAGDPGLRSPLNSVPPA